MEASPVRQNANPRKMHQVLICGNQSRFRYFRGRGEELIRWISMLERDRRDRKRHINRKRHFRELQS